MKHEAQKIFKDEKTGKIRVVTVNDEPSMTVQSSKDECDINRIMEKYEKTGAVTHLAKRSGIYGDFSELTDYQGMLDKVMFAQDAFMTLPAAVRTRFRNDPGALLEFLQDSKNRDEAVRLGLIEAKPSEQTVNNANKLDERDNQVVTKGKKPKSKPAESEELGDS